MEGYSHPYNPHQRPVTPGETAAGDRFPQWSPQETKEFLRVRAEMDRAFMETKRNKLLWEIISAKLKEKGFGRTAEQCKSKWKNLVTRYKGSETMEEDEAMRVQQFPFYTELRAIFSARLHQMLWAETEGSAGGTPASTSVGRKRKGKEMWSDEGDYKGDDSDDEETKGKKKKKKTKLGVREVLEEYMGWQEEMEERWREEREKREEERRKRDEEWRKKMAEMEEERRRMEMSWREREEERRAREEARATTRDALVHALLSRIRRDDHF